MGRSLRRLVRIEVLLGVHRSISGLALACLALVGGAWLAIPWANIAEPPRLRAGLWPMGPRSSAPASARGPGSEPRTDELEGPPSPRPLAMPDGRPPQLRCEQARRVVAQARAAVVTDAVAVAPDRFAAATSDWLDPHGLWSVAPDAPLGDALRESSEALLQELEREGTSTDCPSARLLGERLSTWVGDLRRELARARGPALERRGDARRRWELATTTPFEDGRVTRPARELARHLGHTLGTLEGAYGQELAGTVNDTVEALLPSLDASRWSEVLLAAAVRAYIPMIDPHGAWAPADEESSIYDVQLEGEPPAMLWEEMTRTAIGVRLDRGALSPLREGDVVVAIGPRRLGGMSVEQANQLRFVVERTPLAITVLRSGLARPQVVEVAPHLELLAPPPSAADASPLPATAIDYGDGRVLVLRIDEVPDDLGERVIEALRPAKARGDLAGVLLDLRGNGGGSTDGAIAALGVFLPGVSLFPMRRRDGTIEVDRAPLLEPEDRWTGPVAALVDGDSASAAEMLAGALSAYERGMVLGARTYGKGCAQEYLDDEAGVGILRLTTLVFCLPSGAPLQRVGLSPDIALGLPAGSEREATLAHAPSPWTGPDVRGGAFLRGPAWPSSGGRIGPAPDPTLHRALRALGSARAVSKR
jgi:carboxyl-terminal processing protease